ncbi:MAG: DUF4335 domain-containing protein [Cyanobacteria bacterium J06632_22]
MTSARQLTTQRFSANACTLEVTASPSALSRWSQQPLLKQARFQLWLQAGTSPRLLAVGDQSQLIALSEQVQTYLYQHIGQPPRSTPPLTQHQLTLLESPQTLSTLELFDLAETLDQYEQSCPALPALTPTVAAPHRQHRTQNRRRQRLLWTGSAAAGLVVALSVTATLRQQPELASTQTAAGDALIEEDFGAPLENAPAQDVETPQVEAQTEAPTEATSEAPPQIASDNAAPAATPDNTATVDAPGEPSPPPVATAGASAPRPSNPGVSPAPVTPSGAAASDAPADIDAPDSNVTTPDALETTPGVLRSQPPPPTPAPAAIPEPEQPPTESTDAEQQTDTGQTFSIPPDTGLEAARTAGAGASRGADAPPETADIYTEAAPVPTETATSIRNYFTAQLSETEVTTPLIYRVVLDAQGRLSTVTPLNTAAEQYPIATTEQPIAPAQAITLQVTVSSNGSVSIDSAE